jgi:hypothetical protein
MLAVVLIGALVTYGGVRVFVPYAAPAAASTDQRRKASLHRPDDVDDSLCRRNRSQLESNIVSRTIDLLGVSWRRWVELRHYVAAAKSLPICHEVPGSP